MPLGKKNELCFLTSSYSLAESNSNRTGSQVFDTVRYSVGIRFCSVLGILIMAKADSARCKNCSAVCCVPSILKIAVLSNRTQKQGMAILDFNSPLLLERPLNESPK